MNRIISASFVCLLALGLTCGSVWAQATAQISGTVQDQSGAVLPGAEITAAGIEGGRHIRYPQDTPIANLYITLLDKLGIRIDTFGDSTGKLDLALL